LQRGHVRACSQPRAATVSWRVEVGGLGWGWTRRVAAAWERAGQGRADTSQGSDAQRGDIHGAGAEEHDEAVCTRCAGERADGVESRSRRHRGRAMLASHGLRVVSPAAAHLSKRPDHGFGLSSSTQQQQTTAQTTTTARTGPLRTMTTPRTRVARPQARRHRRRIRPRRRVRRPAASRVAALPALRPRLTQLEFAGSLGRCDTETHVFLSTYYMTQLA
jgi:hypothetical protein